MLARAAARARRGVLGWWECGTQGRALRVWSACEAFEWSLADAAEQADRLFAPGHLRRRTGPLGLERHYRLRQELHPHRLI